ncbi:MAG TPA: hypothetical protein VMW50_03320 [Dehalococcoidia bacterium]|nr:hypothetical protein [Dehalococcoidia bacterium]
MSLKEKILSEMVFPNEIIDQARETFKALPSEKKSVLRYEYIVERLERQRLWNLVAELKKTILECDNNYDHDNMDEMDALEHFQKYHEILMSIISTPENKQEVKIVG